MNKSLVVEIFLVILAIIMLVVMLVFVARDQNFSFEGLLAGLYSLMFAVGAKVMRHNREERERKELLAEYPHMSWLYER